MTKIKFCVGVNGERNNLLTILNTFSNHIHEVFGAAPPEVLGTGRIGYTPVTENQLAKDIEIAHDFDVGYNVVLNAYTLEFTLNWQDRIKRFLEFMDKNKGDGVIIANQDLLKFVLKYKPTHLKVDVSTFADIITVEEALKYERLDVDRIQPHQNINRNLPELKKLIEKVKIDIKLLVNNGCTYNCGVRIPHRIYQTKVSTFGLKETDQFREDCITYRDSNPLEIVKAMTIRPEYLHIYEELGFHLFKVAGRTQSTEWMLKVLGAYVNKSYDGFISDLCDTNRDRIHKIPNKKLEGLLEFVGWDPVEYEKRCGEFYRAKIQKEKVFLAGGFEDRWTISKYIELFKELGYEVYDWTAHSPVRPYEEHEEQTKKRAEDILDAVVDATYFIFINNKNCRNGYVELGTAILSRKMVGNPEIYVLGDNDIMYFFHPLVKHRGSIEQIILEIKGEIKC